MEQLRPFALGGDLRRQIKDEGYAYLPSFFDRETLAPIIADIREVLARAGWLAKSVDLELNDEFRRNASRASFRDVYADLQRLEGFHRLGHDQRILALVTEVLQDEVFCHPAKVLRIVTPSTDRAALATGPHQDIVRLHLEPDVLTAWICLSPCTVSSQGLRILADSHLGGYIPPDNSLTRSLPVYLPLGQDDARWMTADYAIGDLVLFHSLTVHAGGPNFTNKVRISMDARYQRTADPLRDEFVRPHGWPRVPDWPELTSDWTTSAWASWPHAVELVSQPPGVSYEEYVATLAVPPSRLLGR